MDATTLRWILIIVGLVIVVGIFLFGNPARKRKPKASRLGEDEPKGRRRRGKAAAERREPTLDGGGSGADDVAAGGGPGGQGELNIGDPAVPIRREPSRPRRPAGPPPDKIVSLFLLARDNHRITGAELLQATVSTGMEFGDMDIFHRLHEATEQPLFSLANAAKPGHFERDEWHSFETAGVVLFLTLPGPVGALDTWDAMLATARRISDLLHAEMLDEEHNPFTRQREAQIREEMRDYDRRKPRAK